MKKFTFRDSECEMQLALYKDGPPALAIQLWDDEGPYCKATVNMPEGRVPADHILVKDCSEQEGIAAALQEQGFAKEIRRIDMGRVPGGISVMQIVDPELLAGAKAIVPGWGVVPEKKPAAPKQAAKKDCPEV
jgi:hypothetical protein